MLLSMLGCGARTELGDDFDARIARPDDARPDDARPADAGRDAFVIDVGPDASTDVFVLPDVATPITCPAGPEIGFRVRYLGTLDSTLAFTHLALGGDGEVVYLVGETASDARLFRLTGADTSARELAAIPSATLGRVVVQAGVARMISLAFAGDFTWQLVLVEARGAEADEIGRTSFGNSLEGLELIWNGGEVVVATTSPDSIAPFGGSEPWALERAKGLAAPGLVGLTLALMENEVRTFGRDGRPTEPPVVLMPPFLPEEQGVVFGVDEGSPDQPFVLAGIGRDGVERRAFVRRYRPDGSAGGGFSAPIETGFNGATHLSTVAISPHVSGYGMVAGLLPGPAIFHGAGEDFVGDSADLPFECDELDIAAGPCGYVIACRNGPAIDLAIPSNPR